MSNNVTSPIVIGTTFETEQQPDGSHRPRHSTPATDAILNVMNGKLPAISNGRMPVDIGTASVTISGPVTVSNEVEIKNDTGNAVPTRQIVAFTPTQTYVAVPAFTAGNTAGTGGTNATVATVIAVASTAQFLSIQNSGPADAELWYGAIPADANVGQTPKKGRILFSGGETFYDVRVPAGFTLYATATSATGLVVIAG